MVIQQKIQLLSIALAVFVSVVYARTPKKIVDGEDASILDFPYQVFLEILDHYGFTGCGGTIIDHRHILTAGHCVYDEGSLIPTENITVIAGIDDLQNVFTENTFEVLKITPHPKYNRSGAVENDIAILKLKKRIFYNDRQKPAKLPTRNIPEYTEVTITGWGRKAIDYSGPLDPYLQKLKSNVINLAKCRIRAGSWKIRSTQICAVGQGGGTPCLGDSGGPLSFNGLVIGIDSRGTCYGDDPTIYTRVYSYVRWIKKTIHARVKVSSRQLS